MTNLLHIKHPSYDSALIDWEILRDVYAGERMVKSRKTKYLSATSGHIADGYGTHNFNSSGYKQYQAYINRARFYNFTREAVQTAIGMMHSKPPEISLPNRMKGILTARGENMEQFLRRINTEQLITGRVGLMLDLPFGISQSDVLPYITTYPAETIINWAEFDGVDDSQNNARMVVLDESGQVQKGDFQWEKMDAYRVLLLAYDEELADVVFKSGFFSRRQSGVSGLNYNELNLIPVTYQGRPLNRVPFVFINSCDSCAEPDEPPYLDLANMCLSIYRMDADYRQNLFMQGQDTLVVVGGANDNVDEAIRTGAGARIDLPQGGSASYIGVESNGLAEQEKALENDKARAASSGAQTMDTVSRERESGQSLGIRMGARTASLNQIALAGANGLQGILKVAAEWMDLNPDEVMVKPNLDFGEASLTAQSMLEMANAISAGFPLSLESVHKKLFEKGFTTKTYAQEIAQLKRERKDGLIKAIEEVTANTNNTQ